MEKAEFFDVCSRVFSQNGLGGYISDGVLEKLHALCVIFLDANKTMNLTALREERQVIAYHFADSVAAAANFSDGARMIDVGSGGGFPTLPLAIVRPDLEITALDATAKKTAFIARAAKELGIYNVKIATGRAEELANTAMRESFDAATARAVAELRVLMEWCVPFIKKDGVFVALKGKRADEELSAAKGAMRALSCELIDYDRSTLIDDRGEKSERATLVFSKYAHTDKIYPRKNAAIMKKPL
ncbi:MAG: 16S rRNA (guanine(527)-N(7))-methyltransferase RsmG [Clostridia bacterium]|nr:16S rRNA (guanine(527)-N(7))-methyltransferase RsmG [Clostridia bacterium]